MNVCFFPRLKVGQRRAATSDLPEEELGGGVQHRWDGDWMLIRMLIGFSWSLSGWSSYTDAGLWIPRGVLGGASGGGLSVRGWPRPHFHWWNSYFSSHPIWVGMKKKTDKREEKAAFLMFSASGKGNRGGVDAPQREAEWWGGRGMGVEGE